MAFSRTRNLCCDWTSYTSAIFEKVECSIKEIISINSFKNACGLKPNDSSYAVGFQRVIVKCRNKYNVILNFNVIPTPADFWIIPPAAFWSDICLSLCACKNHYPQSN